MRIEKEEAVTFVVGSKAEFTAIMGCASKDEYRANLNGIWLSTQRVFATNGHMLALWYPTGAYPLKKGAEAKLEQVFLRRSHAIRATRVAHPTDEIWVSLTECPGAIEIRDGMFKVATLVDPLKPMADPPPSLEKITTMYRDDRKPKAKRKPWLKANPDLFLLAAKVDKAFARVVRRKDAGMVVSLGSDDDFSMIGMVRDLPDGERVMCITMPTRHSLLKDPR